MARPGSMIEDRGSNNSTRRDPQSSILDPRSSILDLLSLILDPQYSLFLVVNRRQFDDLERAHAARRLNLYFIAFFLIQQTLSDRRRRRDQPFLEIGLFGSDETVGDLFVAVQVA